MDLNFKVENNKEQNQYEAYIEDVVALVKYKLKNDSISLYSVKVPSKLEGKGVGSRLLKIVLEDVKKENLKIIRHPICPFVKAYISRNYETWGDLYDKGSVFEEESCTLC